MQNLETLKLSFNKLQEFNITKKFYPKLINLGLEQNRFSDFKFLDQLDEMNIINLRNKKNPVD